MVDESWCQPCVGPAEQDAADVDGSEPWYRQIFVSDDYHACKDSARRRQYKTKKPFFVFIVEAQPIFAKQSQCKASEKQNKREDFF